MAKSDRDSANFPLGVLRSSLAACQKMLLGDSFITFNTKITRLKDARCLLRGASCLAWSRQPCREARALGWRTSLETGGWVSSKWDVLSSGRASNSRSTPQHNLPAARSSFVGREREMLEVEFELAITRLLTLTGAGGSGKTRLALQVARDLIEAYPNGVWLVELAPLSEEVLVPKVVAEALGVPERPQEPLADTLADVLGSRQLLLVLDNCEHLLEATAHLVDKLLDSCPRVRILATSREALRVEGEARWLVPPLSMPERGRTPSSEQLEGYESVRLFVERTTENPLGLYTLTPERIRHL